MNLNYRQKEIFWLRFAGWFCLLPATTYLYLYQNLHSWFCLGELIIIVLFAAYILATAKSDRWTDPKNMMTIDLCFNFCCGNYSHSAVLRIPQLQKNAIIKRFPYILCSLNLRKSLNLLKYIAMMR